MPGSAWTRRSARFRARIQAIFGAFPADSQANEAVTETEIIFPVLEALAGPLCRSKRLRQGRQDVPDVLLFADAAAKQARWRSAGTSNATITAPLSSNANAGCVRWIAATARSPGRQRAVESDVALSEPGRSGLGTVIQWAC